MMELNDINDKKADVVTREDVARGDTSSSVISPSAEAYRLYKRRWAGLVGLCLLNIIAGLNWLWFSSIAIATSEEFGVSLQRVNWLGNSVNLIYLPISILVPLGFSRWGLRISCAIGSLSLLISAWIRYAGTTPALSPGGKYTLLLIAQVLTGCGQPWFQILGPKYSETWFDLRGRTTATMIIAIANPIGAALSQLIAPVFSTVRDSVLVLAIITTVAVPTVMLIYPMPPTPPTYAGSHPSPPAAEILRAWMGKARPGEAVMSSRERLDMAIVTLLFGILVGAFDAFSILINQIFAPYGYSSDAAGIMGGVLILAGIIGAAITSPIFDRYLTHHLALAAKILIPLLAASYIALIWDVRANNYAGLYVVMVVIGVASFTLLPIALEIGCEVTRSAETSSAVLWFAGNLLSVVFVLSMDALRDDSPGANPPANMRKSLIFQACFVAICAVTVLGLKGQQNRREMDIGFAIAFAFKLIYHHQIAGNHLRKLFLPNPSRFMHIKAHKSPQKNTRNKNHSEISSPVLAQHGSRLLQLPSELLTHLTAYLDPAALIALASVCRALRGHVAQDNTWRSAFLYYFLGISPDPELHNDHPKLVLLRRTASSWRGEFQKHWVMAKRWERTRNATSVTHRPHRTPISATHVMQFPKNTPGAQHNWAILSASLTVGSVVRSYPFSGKVVRGHFDASNMTNALGLGLNPNLQEAFSNVSAISLASSGGTGLIVWGLRSGAVAVTVAPRAMEASCSARMIKCSLGDAHRMLVEDIHIGNDANGSEHFVTAAADGSVKLWNLPTNQRGQLNCIWTGDYADGKGLASEVVALVKVPCVKITSDLHREVVAAGYADGTMLVWFGIASLLDSSGVQCVRIAPPSIEPLPVATLRIHVHSRTSTSILVHHINDPHFYRLEVHKETGLNRRTRFGGGPLGALSAITTEFVKQSKEDLRATSASNSVGPSAAISLIGTPAGTGTPTGTGPPTPIFASPLTPITTSLSVPLQIQLALPKPGSSSAPRERNFVAAGDALGRVCVWDWDSEGEIGVGYSGRDIQAPEKDEHEVRAAVAWDALDGEGVSALVWSDVVVAVGGSQGNTSIFDSLTQQLLRRISSPSPASAQHEREAVTNIIVEGDTILVSVGGQVIACQARKDPEKGWNKTPVKGKRAASGKGGGTVAKWQQRNEMNTEISHSLHQMKDEHARSQPALRRARAQAGALADMGLDEADAVQYLMMLSRDEEDARITNEALARESEAASPREEASGSYGSPPNSTGTHSSPPSASTSPSSRRSGRSVYIPASRGPRPGADDIPDHNPYMGSGMSPHQSGGSHGGGRGSYGTGGRSEIDEDEALRLALEISLLEQ